MSNVIQLLFPMGGLGSRFSAVGIETPKPLIPVKGIPMIQRAVSSFDALLEADPDTSSSISIHLIFIVRQEHEEKFGLRTKLDQLFMDEDGVTRKKHLTVTFVMMENDTRGAVETCLLARRVILPEAPLVVMDCDLYFRCTQYEGILADMSMGKSDIGGLLVHFNSRAPRYSYAEVDEKTGYVVRTAEKIPISDKSLIGAYGFGTGKLFVECGDILMESPIDPEKGMKEYYLSLLFNIMLERGIKVKAVLRDDYATFGTPDELQRYEKGLQSYASE